MGKGKRKGRARRIAIAVAATVALSIGGAYLYVQDYYHATPEAISAYAQAGEDGVSVRTEGDLTILTPAAPSGTGLIFYPGGKVEEGAYLPLLRGMARRGVTCVLVGMPFRLAVLGVDRADGVAQRVPGVRRWYMGGHSLGGAMASSYAERHADGIEGLILLGAYPVHPSALPTLAIYGSEDGVLHRDKLEGVENVVVIAGGNHAGFGDYGAQSGDGQAAISNGEQQAQSIAAICAFMGIDER